MRVSKNNIPATWIAIIFLSNFSIINLSEQNRLDALPKGQILAGCSNGSNRI